MRHYFIASLTLLLTLALTQPAQTDFLASFPNLEATEFPNGNILYHPQNAEVYEGITLSTSPQTVMRFEQANQNADSSYVVRASLAEDGSEQLRWTVLYNTTNISNSLNIRAHTVVLPANGNLYSIETVTLDAPLALDSLDVQHKYVLQGDVLSETPQPFFYIGQETTTSDFIVLSSLPEGGERIAGVAADSPVTILSLSVTAEGAYLLVASPFGLAGWLPVGLEFAASNSNYRATLAELSPSTEPSPTLTSAASTSAPPPALTPTPDPTPTPSPIHVTAPDESAPVMTTEKVTDTEPHPLAQFIRNTFNKRNTQNIFTVENAQGKRWLGFAHQDNSERSWLIDARLEIDVAAIINPLYTTKVGDGAAQLPDEGAIVGYVDYAPSYPCTSELHFIRKTGKHLILEEVLLSGEDICINHGTVSLSAGNEGSVMWRYYRPDRTFDSDAVLVEAPVLNAEHSTARHWNEALLHAIRQDFARPTVHARNLYHTAIALYDAWAIFDDTAETVLLGKDLHNFSCSFDGFPMDDDANIVALQEETMSFAAYHLLEHRFSGAATTDANRENRPFYGYLLALGYKPQSSTDYSTGSAAALGTHLADCLIAFGLQDGAQEANGYSNQFYTPVNDPLTFSYPGIEPINPNHWQPLNFLGDFIDQSGNVSSSSPSFLGAEWGNVLPFALDTTDRTIYQRDGNAYSVYHDPTHPPFIQDAAGEPLSDEEAEAYAWGFALVAAWSSHLDPKDNTMIDISPRTLGNLPVDEFPSSLEEFQDFYNIVTGDDPSHGHAINPATGEAYQPQMVRLGDYTRVLAEFWADGPDSETPPGHWFTILNYVSDHPSFVPRFQGQGEILSGLEWDVKAYLALGGAVHDAAISAWSIKGWYDYIRPISAIRFMAAQGQRSDPTRRNYSPLGIPLIDGIIEVIGKDDPLALNTPANVGRIKIRGWRGQDVANTRGVAGVGWILADNWMPYQRANFVTPPFAGYVSGHSTFSRTAAEVLTLLTGDEFFPGGMGEFYAPKNNFLVFEEGPSEDIVLQWATYRDASDQTALSRIWGGIHPPADDIPGRLIGIEVGHAAFARAVEYFNGDVRN